jgi:hypothetical protein
VSQRLPEVVATRLLGDRGGQEDDRFEAIAQPVRQAGHLLGVARRLIAPIKLAIPRLRAFDFGPPLPQFRGHRLRRLPLLQLLQTLQCREVLGGLRDDGGQFAPLSFDVPARRGKPGRQAVDLRPSRRLGRQVLQGGPRVGEPIRSHRPVQPCPPDGSVIGAALEASVDPPCRFVVGAGPNREVCSPQPDPVVVGSQPADLVEVRTDGIHGREIPAQLHVQPRQVDGLLGRPFALRIQVPPPRLDQPLGLFTPAFLHEGRNQQHPEARSLGPAGIGCCALDEALGIGQPPLFGEQVHPARDRSPAEGRIRSDPGPGRIRLRRPPARLLADAQQVGGLVRIGPPRQEGR